MKILLTNDDGIYSEGIQILKKQLDKIAEVTIIAPDRERSTIGHAMTLRKPLRIRKEKINGDFCGFSLPGRHPGGLRYYRHTGNYERRKARFDCIRN